MRLTTNPNTAERAALICKLAETVRYTYGKKRGQYVGKNTIRNWLNAYENSGMTAVYRKSREDSGSKRVLVSRTWDKTVKQLGFRDEEIQRLAADLTRRVASLWRSGSPSVPMVQTTVLSFAVKQLEQKACTLSKEELLSVCKLPEKFIKRQEPYKLAAIFRQDAAGAYSD